MRLKDITEAEEKLFIVQVTDLEFKGTEYVVSLSPRRLSPNIGDAVPVTKDEWETCVFREILQEETFRKRFSWGSEEKPKYRSKLIKYIPDAKDLIPVYVQVTNKNFGLTDVKKFFTKDGIKILLTEKGRYSVQYSKDFQYYNILYIRKEDLERAEILISSLKNQIDIGFAEPDRRTSASDRLTY